MITFQRVQLEDRQLLHPLLYHSGNWGCEYTFTNQYIWGRQEYAFVEGCLIPFAHWDGQSTYVYPVGGCDHKAAVIRLMDDAHKRGVPFRLSGINDKNRAELEANFPGLFHFQARRSSFDYVYHIHRLAELGGKKMQQKRNHINRFVQAHPDWQAEPLCRANLEECREMAAHWYRLQEDPEKDFLLEKRALRRAFDAFEALEMDGLLIRTEGRIVAFTMGNRINDRFFDVNFEKAYADIQGSYAIVNREFARMLREKYPALEYLNREEDMGLPGLRKSKESYHPDFLLQKYRAYLAEEVM